MAAIRHHDFVEIEYTGRLKEDNSVFDTTQENVTKEQGSYDKKHGYGPVIICIGENNLLKSVEEQMVGKETGKEYSFEIGAEQAFGRKNASLLQLIPLSKFRQQKIQPVPGLQLNIDGVFGVVKTVSGGRCYVDFNHPLAGKDLIYEIKINRILDDDKEKINSLLKAHLDIRDAEIELKDGSAGISLKNNLPKEAQEEFRKITDNLIPNIKNIEFNNRKEEI